MEKDIRRCNHLSYKQALWVSFSIGLAVSAAAWSSFSNAWYALDWEVLLNAISRYGVIYLSLSQDVLFAVPGPEEVGQLMTEDLEIQK